MRGLHVKRIIFNGFSVNSRIQVPKCVSVAFYDLGIFFFWYNIDLLENIIKTYIVLYPSQKSRFTWYIWNPPLQIFPIPTYNNISIWSLLDTA